MRYLVILGGFLALALSLCLSKIGVLVHEPTWQFAGFISFILSVAIIVVSVHDVLSNRHKNKVSSKTLKSTVL